MLRVAVPNKGFRVRELSDRELDEITEIRLLLEVPTTVKAVELASAERLARLRPVAQRIVSAARDTDLISYIEHDRQFHQALLGLAGNELLVSMVSELRSRSRLYGLRQLADRGELVASGAEHVAMLDLIEAGDRAGLERLMRKHIGHVRGSWAGRSEGGTENTRNEEASR